MDWIGMVWQDDVVAYDKIAEARAPTLDLDPNRGKPSGCGDDQPHPIPTENEDRIIVIVCEQPIHPVTRTFWRKRKKKQLTGSLVINIVIAQRMFAAPGGRIT